MIYKSISLENFRQYKGINTFAFSPSNDKNISIIIAENGVGKTTLLQAFRFCFFGNLKNSKYVNLPNANELLNFSISNSLSPGMTEIVKVKVDFEFKGDHYSMLREQTYSKIGDRVKVLFSNSKLVQVTPNKSIKSYVDDEADIHMMQIMPPGLSHIFMFDGERMEKPIGSREFKADLKDSILGILDFKKYDELLIRLGDINKSSSVLGRVHSKMTNSSLEEREATNRYKNALTDRDNAEAHLNSLTEHLESTNIQIEQTLEKQKLLDLNKEIINQRDDVQNKINLLNQKIEQLSEKMLNHGYSALLNKELISIKKNFDEFLYGKSTTENFFQQLHVDTLKQILENKYCLCGELIKEGSVHEHNIKKLFETALPNDNSHYLSFIKSDILSRTLYFKEDLEAMHLINSDLQELFSKRKSYYATLDKLNHEIRTSEIMENIDYQIILEDLHRRKEELIKTVENAKTKLKAHEIQVKKLEIAVKPMWDANARNKKINETISKLNIIKENLTKIKEDREKEARKILSEEFEKNISLMLSGNYKTFIDSDYSISIFDNDKNVDVTNVVSTGQSVVVSISFINSLIKTAEKLSTHYSVGSKYGVVMDAALSNLDEKHTKKISEHSLTKFDQLIFISFKRQLRHEMIQTILSNVNSAYEIKREGDNILIENINLTDLDEHIHRLEAK